MHTSEKYEDELRHHLFDPQNLDLLERYRRAYSNWTSKPHWGFESYVQALRVEGLI